MGLGLLKLARGFIFCGGVDVISLQLSPSAQHRLQRGNTVSSLYRWAGHNCGADLSVVRGCS